MDPIHDTQPLAARIMSSIRRTKSTWPDPEASTGDFIRMMGSKMCFRATGPALDAFTRFSKDIEEYLNKFSDALPETVLRTPCMIGTKKKKLRPAVLFSSSDQDAREKAQKCIQDSGILQREGFVSMTCNRPPEFPTLMTLTMDETEHTAPGSSSTHCITFESSVRGSFATQISFPTHISIFDVKDSHKMLATATGGGILEWNKRMFLMTAAHAFQTSEKNDLFTDDTNYNFEYEFNGDDFSDDDNDDDDDEMVDPTGLGSKTSEEDLSDIQRSMSADLSSTPSASLSTDLDTRTSYTSAVPESSPYPIRHIPSAQNTENHGHKKTICSLKGPFASSIAGLSPLLDYALIEITGLQVGAGDISLPPSSRDGSLLEKKEAVEMNGPSDIIALSASKGSIKGRLTGIPSFGTAPNSTVSQELWTIHLEGKLEKGDCGCWIIDAASGAVYGHIIAGSPGTGIGLIAPLKHVLNDLVERLGGDWRITSRSGLYSTSDPKSSPRHSSNTGPAEGAVTNPALHGLPSSNLRLENPRISSPPATHMSESLATLPSSSLATSISGSSTAWPSSSLVTSFSGLDTTWLSLLDDKTHDVENFFGQDYPGDYRDISSGRSFRSALKKLSKETDEYKYAQLEVKIVLSLAPISKLAKSVDQAFTVFQHLAPNETLESLVWWISFAVIECGCRVGARLTPLVNLITDLNKRVPQFSARHLRYANEQRLQKPLQDIYSLFIDSHLSIMIYLGTRKSTLNVDPIKGEALQTFLNEIARLFEKPRGLFEVMMKQAAKDEERKVIHLQQWSLEAQRTLPHYLHHDSTPNRDVPVKFISLRSLGRGSYGKVDEVRELSTGVSYARKRIAVNSDKPSDVIAKEVKNEVAIMQKLRHLHIATVLFHLKEEDAYSIFMLPVADYDLRKFLSLCTKQDHPLALTELIYPWFGCLLDALAFAHKLKIRHEDIKPSNILIKNNQPYLSDFGLAQDFSELGERALHDQKVQGTLIYRPPDIESTRFQGSASDVFSLGCVYSEMFTVTQGKPLEEYQAFRRTADSIAFHDCLEKMRVWLRSFESNKLSDLLVDQILHMTDGDAMARPSAEQAMNSLKGERALFCVE